MMIKEETHQDKILILNNKNVPKNRASNFIKQKMVKLKRETETYTTIIKYFYHLYRHNFMNKQTTNK